MSAKNEIVVIPKWINEEYFLPIIEKEVEDFEKIKHFASTAATQPGDNYMSLMVRVTITIEVKNGSERILSYIVKTTLESDKGGDFVAGMSLFPKEKQMYQVHISNFTRIYKEAGVDIKLAPKCVHIDETPERITLILEDLKHEKFYNVDRLKGFDMEHMRHVLHKVAELHAASAVCYEQNGSYDEIFQHSIFTENNRKVFEAVSQFRQAAYIKAMREWELPDVEHYVEAIPSPSKYFDTAIALNQVDESEFNCLNHGDLWSNNIMFADKGGEKQTLFVDFQVGKWGNPAQDLWYLIVSSSSLDIKIEEFDNFLFIYHKRLVECLKLLKYSKPIPTLRELHVMMIKYGAWGSMTANGVMVIVLMPSDKDSNINMMMAAGAEADAFRYKMFSNPAYVKAMIQLLPFFRNKGIL